ncbi:MAG: serine/threonine protein kinase [Candidatus Eremiobacteraeota bacterium]|nr:serine/threonine protein kinase [Candidatus Eremiobacteraeota bacterium]MBV8284113.1 serine/threonine protein kinase [Candidatus Eremiobacteraeota bacterium]MBV8434941.1 serine/threonine protein kinase [Candidatus Eremiobacteraeota bacterium]MBV8655509.1 serine/threonine protein kinase [Candidatus Eremiobacteraeota bacterium]
MDHLQGRTLGGGRYNIVELIGRGGTADTYRAADETLGRDVAIKVLMDRSDDTNSRLLAEARAMARLNHPRIVAVYDAGEEDSVYYIVMELIRGKTLSSLESGELGYKQALTYVAEVLEALDYANGEGVIHRDIKPSNVMILDDGKHIKLMDFGLARRASDVTQTTRTGQIVGTISYLAPERFLSKPADARSDLYSVGIVMYEIFTGTLPFRNDRDDIVATMYSHVNDIPTSPREINRNIPEPLEQVIMRAIEREPGSRYQTALEFYNDVEALMASQPPPNAKQRPPKAYPTIARKPPTEAMLRQALDRALAPARNRSDALENVLKGMIATRRRNYDEARDAYLVAMHELQAAGNEVEYAKTALKYGAMVLQKAADGKRDRNELRDAVNRLNESLKIFREYGLQEQFSHTEYTINALERTAIGVIY